MSVAASYSAAIKVDGSVLLNVHVEPDALAPAVIASAATLSDCNMYCPARSCKIICKALGEVKSMSCTDKVTCPAKVVFVTTFDAITGVVADGALSSVDCVATDG